MLKLFLLFAIQFAITACAHAAPAIRPVGCEINPKLQEERSGELLRIAKDDQADRLSPFDSTDWNKVRKRDLQRRIRVATIFAEGCFKIASDYASAATVYQHGNAADHFYQAFVWANRAVKLGNDSQLWATAAGLDRYLVKIGQKQLFGTQLYRNGDGKWCIQPVEPTFPENVRIEYVRFSVKEQIARALKGNGIDQNPDEVSFSRIGG